MFLQPIGPVGIAAGSGGGKGIAGTSGAAGATGAAGASATVSAGTLTIDFTTVNQHGMYAPANVGAVWIETSTGMFVRTLERWAGIRAAYLRRWAMASGGWNSFFGIGARSLATRAFSRISKATAKRLTS